MNDANTPTTPTAQMPTNSPMPVAGPTMELSSDQAETMTGWIKADFLAGKMTQEDATKAFNQLGATAEQRASDTRSEEMKQLDAQLSPGEGE